MSSHSRRWTVFGRGWQRTFAVLVLAVAAILILGMALAGYGRTQSASPGAGPGSPTPTASTSPTPSATTPLSMTASDPQTIKIPAMKVDTSLERLQQKESKYVSLPKKASRPGWYTQSATPGELGIATIVGYIRESAKVPGVFVNLKSLGKGDKIRIARENGSDAIFSVDRIKVYSTKNFDSDAVYGQTKPRAELRLITCGGKLHADDPTGNVVVFAHLVDQNEPGQ